MCEATTVTKPLVEVGMGRTVRLPFDAALKKVEQALLNEGFGVLTRIDVKEILKKKLGVERAPFVILGACSPQLAHRALGLEPRVGLLLPCNVVVREVAPGETCVEAVNPETMMGLFPEADLESVAHEARQRLVRAIDTLVAPVPT
jgi:uncharacterized protein (DUF302 family)